VYEVNEGFGQVRRGPGAFRNAFSLTLSARLAVGGIPALNDRGFGPMRGGPGGFGGMRGFGGPGGFGGGPDGPRGRGEGGAGRSFNVVGLLDRMLANPIPRSEEHTSELQSRENLVCRLLLEKKKLYLETQRSLEAPESLITIQGDKMKKVLHFQMTRYQITLFGAMEIASRAYASTNQIRRQE